MALPEITFNIEDDCANDKRGCAIMPQGGLAPKISKMRRKSISDQTIASPNAVPKTLLVYNDYGELVEADSGAMMTSTKDLTSKQMLRLISTAYHNNWRSRMRAIIMAYSTKTQTLGWLEDGTKLAIECTSWEFVQSASSSPNDIALDDVQRNLAVYPDPPRILDVGCENGNWCIWIKKNHPDWNVEGLDDNPRNYKNRTAFGDSMITEEDASREGTFDSIPSGSSPDPVFIARNVNTLLAHKNPIPLDHYSFVRGRNLFGKVESYKGFLEDVRLILQPEGVVEFLEIDPRLRCTINRDRFGEKSGDNNDHTSSSQSDWTSEIADRFIEPSDRELDIQFPNWNKRIGIRLEAELRPKDGIPAVNLKAWLQGAGFWDVKEMVLPFLVGGSSPTGEALLALYREQLDIENTIPLLAAALPKVSIDDISSGNTFINLHTVTARKPKYPRAGDLLADGTRKETTATKYDTMARMNDAKSNHWQRFDLKNKLRAILDDAEWRADYRTAK